MFFSSCEFEYATAFRVERMLEQTEWTDVVAVEVDGAVVYEDQLGVSNDLVPALDILRGASLHRHTAFEVILGRQYGPWQMVSAWVSNALELKWTKSVRDLRLDPGPEESPRDHHDRLREWLAEGYLTEARQALGGMTRVEVEQFAAAGMKPRGNTLHGPWLQLRWVDPGAHLEPAHASFGGRPSSVDTDQVLLELLLEAPAAPDIEVRVDHIGEVVSVPDLRETLVMLATPLVPRAYDEDGALESSR